MVKVNLDQIEKINFGYENDETSRVTGIFPLSAATGNKNTATVHFELEPKKKLATHTDSAEEILFIFEGKAEVTIGEEKEIVEAPALAVVPAMIPHSVLNIGKDKVRVVGFFSSNTIMSTFDQPLVPLDPDIPTPPQSERTLVTPFPVQLEEVAVEV
jgi:quercetin dioxygenase-like cupin family protein